MELFKPEIINQPLPAGKGTFSHWKDYPRFEGREGYIYPRTMLEAFPRATSHELWTPYPKLTKTDKIFIAIGLCLFVIGLAAAGVSFYFR